MAVRLRPRGRAVDRCDWRASRKPVLAAAAPDTRNDEARYKRRSASGSARMAECLTCETGGRRETLGWCSRYSRPPALDEHCHCCLARRLVAVRWPAVLVVAKGQRPHPRRTERARRPTFMRSDDYALHSARLIAIAAFARDSISLGGVDQRRVKPLRIHGLVQKAASSGADLAPRIAADEERWNRGKCWNRECAAEPFDGIDSSRSS